MPLAKVVDAVVRVADAVPVKVGDAVVKVVDAAPARVGAAPVKADGAKVDVVPAKAGAARERADEARGRADVVPVRAASRHVIRRRPSRVPKGD